jgi:hypothetical protein
MATLNTLSQHIASSFDRDTDVLFIERIKDLIIQTRSFFIHREIDKYGINEQYIQPYDAELELVNASELTGITSKSTLLRTTNKIPTPVRYQSDVPFVFVGSADRLITFRYIKPYVMRYIRSLPLIGNSICYFYINGYVYIYNNTKLERVLIDAVYNSLDVTESEDSTGICYKDDMEFPLAGDLLNAVIDEVTRMIRNTQDATDKNPVTLRDIS